MYFKCLCSQERLKWSSLPSVVTAFALLQLQQANLELLQRGPSPAGAAAAGGVAVAPAPPGAAAAASAAPASSGAAPVTGPLPAQPGTPLHGEAAAAAQPPAPGVFGGVPSLYNMPGAAESAGGGGGGGGAAASAFAVNGPHSAFSPIAPLHPGGGPGSAFSMQRQPSDAWNVSLLMCMISALVIHR